jgi:hypothetical protein
MNIKHAIGTLNNIIDELDTKAECLDTVGDATGAERANEPVRTVQHSVKSLTTSLCVRKWNEV